MASGEKSAPSQGVRLGVGRSHDQRCMSTQRELSKAVLRMRTNKTDQGAVVREKEQCPSGHWEGHSGPFLSELAGSCNHFYLLPSLQA